MDYQDSKQVDVNEIEGNYFDLIITSSGYETRAVTLIKNHEFSGNKKIAFAFNEKQSNLSRKDNDIFFLNQGFELFHTSGDNADDFVKLLEDFFLKLDKDKVKLLIDYSCMTKSWYAGILNFFNTRSLDQKEVSIFFSYTPASFNLPKKNYPVRFSESLLPKKNAGISSKPLALILGLGIDYEKANFLVKKLNPTQLILLYADPAFDKKYVQTVLKKNRPLIESVEIRNLMNFPLANIELTNEILTSLVLILRIRYNIIIAPLGPKIFSLCSLLVAARYPDIDVWRVSSGSGNPAYDRLPAKNPLILHTRFLNEDIDN